MRVLIKGGHVIDPKTNTNGIMDILVEDGIITEIGKDIEIPNGDIIYAEGKMVLPGLVDAHCHLRDPGFEYKEDIETGTMSAAMGGFTSIACMPNTDPVCDNEAIVKYIINKAKQDGFVNVYPIGAISKGQKGEELSEIGELKFAGAVAISDDGKPLKSSSLMKKALEYSSMFDIAVISHCEEMDIADGGVMNEGYWSTIMGLKGIPSAAEEIMVARDIILSEYTKVPVHIAHVSTELSIDLIRHAKKRGVKVTCETCPHYFVLTDEACSGFNTLAKVNPPLRTKKDVEAVIEGLKDGTIDMIATDHAPHHNDEKNVEFNLAANGMVGFETALPLAITYLVKPGHLTISQLVEKMCVNPSKLLGINKGTLEIGRSADITIIDINEEFVVDINNFKSKSKNSPFNGFKLNGSVYYTLVNGNAIVREKILL
ncbi:dihydroorotase [Acetivibrio mesophilus]|uniref:Dihydroorotase n=1 Tax=Acetivibrio mesophilus TaxID=2487273 RepID=A0A4Q0I9U6_9FIRM|nr:dihydroorotase [Acetivibrio mesophilus]ODM25200.1 dihydroorotase [Clostridium sp. Bc-iso-3]RXE59782.1 dihydroorotase [Acetivibrio mesophilus]HHV29296.1 dihydroorotase [Clostridium sp.]